MTSANRKLPSIQNASCVTGIGRGRPLKSRSRNPKTVPSTRWRIVAMPIPKSKYLLASHDPSAKKTTVHASMQRGSSTTVCDTTRASSRSKIYGNMDDPRSSLNGFLRASPLVIPVAILFVALVYASREAAVALIAYGAMMAIVWIAKQYTARVSPDWVRRRPPSPEGCGLFDGKRTALDDVRGMPSGHAAAAAFVAALAVVRGARAGGNVVRRALAAAALTVFVWLAVRSRVEVYKCHSYEQALAGVALGGVSGAAAAWVV
jgi:hypothetical protein